MVVAEDPCNRCKSMDPFAAGQRPRQPYRGRGFEDVEYSSQESRAHSSGAHRVGSSRAPALHITNIPPADQPDEQKAKGDRTDKVSSNQGTNMDKNLHGFCSGQWYSCKNLNTQMPATVLS